MVKKLPPSTKVQFAQEVAQGMPTRAAFATVPSRFWVLKNDEGENALPT